MPRSLNYLFLFPVLLYVAVGNNNEPIKRPPQIPKEAKLSALKEDLQRFLLTSGKDFADIELKIEDSLVPAHKAILCARSSYFEGMFRSFKLNNDPVPISIGELIPSKQSFYSLMRYIYYGDVCMPPEDSLYLFTAHAFYIFTNNRLQVHTYYIGSTYFRDTFFCTSLKYFFLLRPLRTSQLLKNILSPQQGLNP